MSREKGQNKTDEVAKIYFLAMEGGLPDWYQHMAKCFEGFNINLSLINAKEIGRICQKKIPNIIISESNLTVKEKLSRAINGGLGHILRNNTCHIHHISSFVARKQLIELGDKKYYYFYRMPFAMPAFCQHIFEQFFSTRKEEQAWGPRKKVEISLG